jgi:omega-6 fatty acid desaturase (delta-12 desaturase)
VGSVLLLPISYLGLHWLWPEFIQLRNFALAFAIYLFAEELVNFPHHSDLFKFSQRLPPWEQWKASRSCDYPWLISELLVLNFNYHTEHHLYPSLPWYRLRTARTLLRPALGSGYIESRGVGWNVVHRSNDIERVFLTEAERQRSTVEGHALQVSKDE